MTYNSVPVVQSTNASDPDIAVDRIGGVDFQRIKPHWGAEGTATEITDADGGRLPVGGGQIGALTESAPATDTASSGLNGRLQRIAQRLTTLITDFGTYATAFGTYASDFASKAGATNETAPVSDTATVGLNGRLQRVAQRLTTLITDFGTYATAFGAYATDFASKTGALTESAPASDTASSGLNGRLQRIAQRITSLIALLPASLGSKAAASSFAVTHSTEDVALLGSLTESAPASDTASSGLNGRLQRIAQRITSLIALLPTALTTAGAFKTGCVETTVAATVASGQTVGIAVDTAGLQNIALHVPSTFDGTTITFQTSHDGSTYQALYDFLGTQVSMTITNSRNYDLPGELTAWRYLKIVCGTAQSTTDTLFVIVARS